jgi:hypothetical protein
MHKNIVFSTFDLLTDLLVYVHFSSTYDKVDK